MPRRVQRKVVLNEREINDRGRGELRGREEMGDTRGEREGSMSYVVRGTEGKYPSGMFNVGWSGVEGEEDEWTWHG